MRILLPRNATQLLVAAIVTSVLYACRDVPTAPRSTGARSLVPQSALPSSADTVTPLPEPPKDSEFGYLESPEFLSATVAIPPQPYSVHVDSVGFYPSPTIATLTKGGSATSYGISPVGSVGAMGWADACTSSNPIWDWSGNAWYGCGGPAIGLVIGRVNFGYNSFVYGLAPSNDVPCWGQQFTGDLSYPDRCTSWTGSFNGTITRLPAKLVAAPSYQAVQLGQYASVSFGPSPAKLPVYDYTPFNVLRTKFEHEDPKLPQLDCEPRQGGCAVRPMGPGMLHIVAVVNGRVFREELYIDIQRERNKLKLAASTARLPKGGGDVTFNAFPLIETKFWGVTGWVFRPDSGGEKSGPGCEKQSSATTCTERITESGTMEVYGFVPGAKPDSASQHIEVLSDSLPPDSLPPADSAHVKLTADKRSVTAGDTVTFSATAPGSKSFSVRRYYFTEPAPIFASRAPTSRPRLYSSALQAGSGSSPHRSLLENPSSWCDSSTDVTCRFELLRSGWQHVVADVDGQTQEDSVEVDVAPVTGSTTCTVDAPGTRGGPVSCEFKLTNSKLAYRVTRHYSTDSFGVIVDSPLNQDRGAGESHFWMGTAVTNTTVRIDAIVRIKGTEVPVVAPQTTFAVVDRIGVDPEWALPPLPVPATEYKTEPDLEGPEPGIYRTKDGNMVYTQSKDGGLGRMKFEVAYTPDKGSGPNEGRWYVRQLTIKQAAVWVRQSLQATSDFAKAQHHDTPKDKFCTAADIETLRTKAEAHERSHFAARRASYLETVLPSADRFVVAVNTYADAAHALDDWWTTVGVGSYDALDKTHGNPDLVVWVDCRFRL